MIAPIKVIGFHIITAIEKGAVHFVRYEDLILTPTETKTELFKFMLGLQDITGTNLQRRLTSVI
jgi:hypothetical protein